MKKKTKSEMSRRSLLKVAVAGVLAGAAGTSSGWLPEAFAADMTGGKKALIVYFSRTGNTRAMASQIHALVGGDLVELEPAAPYPAEYRATTEQAKQELESGHLPPLKTKIEDVGSYDVVFVGSPSWWATWAGPVRTFLSANALAGKTVVPFITHEGSGMGRAAVDLALFCPKAVMLEGLAVRGSGVSGAGGDVAAWLRRIGVTAG